MKDEIYRALLEINKVKPLTKELTPEYLARAIYVLSSESELRGFLKAVEALHDPAIREMACARPEMWAKWLLDHKNKILNIEE